jgi:uncharacterized peroxidase-related enzyme
MSTLKIHTKESAPEKSRDILEQVEKELNFIPNMLGAMANASALLKGYLTLSKIFEETSFTSTEKQIILLQTSYVNTCEYCVSAHTVLSGMQNISRHITDAIRNNTPIEDPKLEALRSFTRAVVESSGYPGKEATKAFLDSGYSESQILEVILGIGFKTLSNYSNHYMETPLDEAFSEGRWEKR